MAAGLDGAGRGVRGCWRALLHAAAAAPVNSRSAGLTFAPLAPLQASATRRPYPPMACTMLASYLQVYTSLQHRAAAARASAAAAHCARGRPCCRLLLPRLHHRRRLQLCRLLLLRRAGSRCTAAARALPAGRQLQHLCHKSL